MPFCNLFMERPSYMWLRIFPSKFLWPSLLDGAKQSYRQMAG